MIRPLLVISLALVPAVALAERYQVGPTREHKQLTEIVDELEPGDVIEVDGGAVYRPIELKRDGKKGAPIVFKGIRKGGKRPVIEGGTYDGKYTLMLKGDWTTFDGFEIRGGSEVCVFNKAHGIVIRDSLIHRCERHGILGADDEAGSILLSYVEVCNAGGERKGESLKHPIYIATDEVMHPDAVFRIEHSWVHSNHGGNNIKSRALRTEVYYNWIEGAQYYELELIGPATKTGKGPPREDSDVVGNVFVNTSEAYVSRIGSDETGQSEGRVRFVNNTFVMSPKSRGVVRLHDRLESVEFYNNAFIHTGKWDRFLRDSEVNWVSGRRIRGASNYVSHDPDDIPNFPAELEDTITGDVCVRDLEARDLRPLQGSPLVDRGASETKSEWSPARVVAQAVNHPALRVSPRAGAPAKRSTVDALDVGAFEVEPDAPRCTSKGGKKSKKKDRADVGAPEAGSPDGDGGASPPVRPSGRTRTIGLVGGAVAVVVASVLIAVGLRRGRDAGRPA